jgi:uncharacterized membrane protein YjgN (DUF898 family)
MQEGSEPVAGTPNIWPSLPPAAPPASSIQHGSENLNFSYQTRPGLLKLTIVNALLSLITLGIYRFWAKNNVRKHIWSSVHINGEPLEYTGTGKELFLGALIVFLLLVLPVLALQSAMIFIYGQESWQYNLVQLATLFLFALFFGFAVYRARKFQLSRTNWRGIRGTMAGSAMTYSLTYFGSLIAKALSFGWATPVMNTVLQEQLIGDMRFGDAAFKFKGPARPLYPTYAMCWLLSALVLVGLPFLLWTSLGQTVGSIFENIDRGPLETGMEEFFQAIAITLIGAFILYMLVIPALWAIYTAKELRTFANYTRFDGAKFHLDASTGSVIWLTVVNLLIIVMTLGIGWPFVQQRLVRFLIDRLSLEGKVEIDRINQSVARRPTRGEGLADAFDVGGL